MTHNTNLIDKLYKLCLIVILLTSCAGKTECLDCQPYNPSLAESIECADNNCSVQIWEGNTYSKTLKGKAGVERIEDESISIKLDMAANNNVICHLKTEPFDISGEPGIVCFANKELKVSYSRDEGKTQEILFEIEGYIRCVNIHELIISPSSEPKIISGTIILYDRKNIDNPYKFVIDFHVEEN